MSISNLPTVRVVAGTDLPTASVAIFDSNYKPIAHAAGSVEAALTPGVYKARYSTGIKVVEKIFEVSLDQTEIFLDKPDLPTPRTTAITVAPGQVRPIEEAAVRASTAHPIPQGSGSQCCILVQDLPVVEPAIPRSSPPPHPGAGLKLFTFEGTLLGDLSMAPTESGCAGLNLELNPGSYLLRLEQPGHDTLEMTVVTCATWQTQLILSLESIFPGASMRLPSFESAVVLMAPLGQGFRPDDETSEWVRMACRWLARGEPVAPISELRKAIDVANDIRPHVENDEAFRDILRYKFTNPMLGIYAAHLLTLTPDPDLSLLREVSINLKLLLGNHPDVIAIELWLDPEAKALPFQSPPMLRNTWKILVNRSRKYEQLVPVGSYSLRISDRLWGSGCWLIWRTPPPATGAWLANPVEPKAIFEYVSNQIPGKSVSQFVQEQVATKNLTGVETSVLAYISSVAQSRMYIGELASKLETGLEQIAPETAQDFLSNDSVTQKLGIPRAAVAEASETLSRKLGLE